MKSASKVSSIARNQSTLLPDLQENNERMIGDPHILSDVGNKKTARDIKTTGNQNVIKLGGTTSLKHRPAKMNRIPDDNNDTSFADSPNVGNNVSSTILAATALASSSLNIAPLLQLKSSLVKTPRSGTPDEGRRARFQYHEAIESASEKRKADVDSDKASLFEADTYNIQVKDHGRAVKNDLQVLATLEKSKALNRSSSYSGAVMHKFSLWNNISKTENIGSVSMKLGKEQDVETFDSCKLQSVICNISTNTAATMDSGALHAATSASAAVDSLIAAAGRVKIENKSVLLTSGASVKHGETDMSSIPITSSTRKRYASLVEGASLIEKNFGPLDNFSAVNIPTIPCKGGYPVFPLEKAEDISGDRKPTVSLSNGTSPVATHKSLSLSSAAASTHKSGAAAAPSAGSLAHALRQRVGLNDSVALPFFQYQSQPSTVVIRANRRDNQRRPAFGKTEQVRTSESFPDASLLDDSVAIEIEADCDLHMDYSSVLGTGEDDTDEIASVIEEEEELKHLKQESTYDTFSTPRDTPRTAGAQQHVGGSVSPPPHKRAIFSSPMSQSEISLRRSLQQLDGDAVDMSHILPLPSTEDGDGLMATNPSIKTAIATSEVNKGEAVGKIRINGYGTRIRPVDISGKKLRPHITSSPAVPREFRRPPRSVAPTSIAAVTTSSSAVASSSSSSSFKELSTFPGMRKRKGSRERKRFGLNSLLSPTRNHYGNRQLVDSNGGTAPREAVQSSHSDTIKRDDVSTLSSNQLLMTTPKKAGRAAVSRSEPVKRTSSVLHSRTCPDSVLSRNSSSHQEISFDNANTSDDFFPPHTTTAVPVISYSGQGRERLVQRPRSSSPLSELSGDEEERYDCVFDPEDESIVMKNPATNPLAAAVAGSLAPEHQDTSKKNAKLPAPLTRSSSVPNVLHWKKGEAIGEGSFGKVFKGLNEKTGELIAVKQLFLADGNVAEIKNLRREIDLIINLTHENIVRYIGTSESERYLYIILEYVPGGSVSGMLDQFGPFAEDLIRRFSGQVLNGVNYMHNMGIIHRDIKGSNILVTDSGIAKLSDFGCSKQLIGMSTGSFNESGTAMKGSVPWMAPEVIKQSGHGRLSDIWSFGATVIEMATGRPPWSEFKNNFAALFHIATSQRPPPFPDTLSLPALDFLSRCMVVEARDRASASELLKDPFLQLSAIEA